MGGEECCAGVIYPGSEYLDSNVHWKQSWPVIGRHARFVDHHPVVLEYIQNSDSALADSFKHQLRHSRKGVIFMPEALSFDSSARHQQRGVGESRHFFEVILPTPHDATRCIQ